METQQQSGGHRINNKLEHRTMEVRQPEQQIKYHIKK